ncbi:MAG: hypothetical protein ACKN9W_17505 [Methylococcus sp.]
MRGIAHGLALFLGVEVLIDPADGFVLAPQRGNFGVIDQIQHLQQRGFAREETALRRVAVEQPWQVLAQLIEHTEEVHAVGIAGFAQASTGQPCVELKALGLEAVAHRLHQQASCLRHAQGGQSVEHGEGLFPNDALEFSGQ